MIIDSIFGIPLDLLLLMLLCTLYLAYGDVYADCDEYRADLQIVISVLLLIGSVVGVGVLSARIYRVGVLLYGTSPKIGSVLKAVFKA